MLRIRVYDPAVARASTDFQAGWWVACNPGTAGDSTWGRAGLGWVASHLTQLLAHASCLELVTTLFEWVAASPTQPDPPA